MGSFDRHTLADLTVNLVPLVMLVAFGALFVVYSPWGRFGLASAIQFGLLGLCGALLSYVSYRTGLAVSRAEER